MDNDKDMRTPCTTLDGGGVMEIAIKLDAGHDRNGNPRRGWIVQAVEPPPHGTTDPNRLCLDRFLGWIEEGYEGRAALTRAFPNAYELVQLTVPFAEIKEARARRVQR